MPAHHMHVLQALMTASQALAFFEANETPRPITIRTNTCVARLYGTTTSPADLCGAPAGFAPDEETSHKR